MTFEQSVRDKDYLNRSVEVSIHVGLTVLLVWACFLILRPFLPPVTWGIVVAIALYPWYRKLAAFLERASNARRGAVHCCSPCAVDSANLLVDWNTGRRRPDTDGTPQGRNVQSTAATAHRRDLAHHWHVL